MVGRKPGKEHAYNIPLRPQSPNLYPRVPSPASVSHTLSQHTNHTLLQTHFPSSVSLPSPIVFLLRVVVAHRWTAVMVLAFELVLRWPLEVLGPHRPWGVWRGGRWAGREGDAYVMVVWTLYGICEWKWERHGVGREIMARVTLNPNIGLPNPYFPMFGLLDTIPLLPSSLDTSVSCSDLISFFESRYWCSAVNGSAKPEAMPVSLRTLLSFDASIRFHIPW